MLNLNIILKIINFLLGSGIFFLINTEKNLYHLSLNGLLGYVLSTSVFLLFTYVFSNNENSFNTLIERRLGKKINLFISWLYWTVSCLCISFFTNTIYDIFLILCPNSIYFYFVLIFFISNFLIILNLDKSFPIVLLVCVFFIFNKKGLDFFFKLALIIFTFNYIKYFRNIFIEKIISLLKIISLIITPLLGLFFLEKTKLIVNTNINFQEISRITNLISFCYLGVEVVNLTIKNKTKKEMTFNSVLGVFFLAILQFLNILAISITNSRNFEGFYNKIGIILKIKSMGIIFSIIQLIIIIGSLISFAIANSEIVDDFMEKKIFNFNFDPLSISTIFSILFLVFLNIFSKGINIVDNSSYITFIFYLCYFLSNQMSISNFLAILFSVFLLIKNFTFDSLIILTMLILFYPLIIFFSYV